MRKDPMIDNNDTVMARRQFMEQWDRLRPVIQGRQVHLLAAAFMGTAGHLRSAHGIEDPPSNAHALALLHLEAHAVPGGGQPAGSSSPGRLHGCGLPRPPAGGSKAEA